MPSPADPAATSGLPFKIPSGQEIYDALMGQIEPELVTANLPLLKEKYKNETPEQKKERQQHYDESFAAYEASFKEWIGNLNAAVAVYRKTVLKVGERKNAEKEVGELANLESAIHAA